MTNYQAALDCMFQALSDPTRRRIVEQLAHGPATVSELAAPLPMALPSVMQHLQVLEASGLIRSEKAGRVRTCRLEPAAMQAAERWLSACRREWEDRLDRLGVFLAETADPPDQPSVPNAGAMTNQADDSGAMQP